MDRGFGSRTASCAPLTGWQLLVDRRPVVSHAGLGSAKTPKVAFGSAGVNEPDPAEIAYLSQAQARRMPESTVWESHR